MDYTFIALKKILDGQKKREMKVIIMSATINSKEFRKYFSVHKSNNEFYKPQIKYDFSGLYDSDYFHEKVMEDTLVKHPNIANYRLCGGFDIPDVKRFHTEISYLDELSGSKKKYE